jgi:hypothetical protein
MTPQGRAIKQAAIDFGNGQTLPFTPCKKGYIPKVEGKIMAACPLHNVMREKRLAKERGVFRKGEVDLKIFWSKSATPDAVVESATAKKVKTAGISEEKLGKKAENQAAGEKKVTP